ncbi:hypothetical protein ACE3MQ_24085 [Paenibacillus lentus]|uniref:hypothetical protein n=1 Tax=Paenibacillus lentus TaxID=1338368 RepID=UPI00364A613C
MAILVHESGHLLVGAWAGLKPEEMIVGPFRMTFSGGSIRFRPNNRWERFGGTMRFSACSGNLDEMARKWSWMALGGPAANLLAGLLILSLLPSSHLWTECLMWISFSLVAATLLPLSNGVGHSDGKLFLLLRKKSARADLLMAGVILQKDYLSELRPAEWNSEVIAATVRLLNSLPERTPEQFIEESELRMFLYCHFADKEQPEEALKYIQPVSVTSPSPAVIPLNRIMIDSLYAGHLFLHSPHGDQSRQEAEAIVMNLPNNEPYSYHKAWAAMLSVQGKKEDASKHLSQAQILLDRWYKPFGAYRFEQVILSQIEDRLQRRFS